jgi:hypothetical protein
MPYKRRDVKTIGLFGILARADEVIGVSDHCCLQGRNSYWLAFSASWFNISAAVSDMSVH